MYGNDHNYANSRLEGTVVRDDKGEPYFVDHVKEGMKCTGYYLLTNEVKEVHLDRLDLTPVSLGYVNLPNHDAVFVVRKPMRRDWRQGMRHGNITVIGAMVNVNRIDYKIIAKTIKNDFESFETVCGKLIEGKLNNTTAWCREFCLIPNGEIAYKGKNTIGYFNTKTKEVVFKEEYNYLKEALMETL